MNDGGFKDFLYFSAERWGGGITSNSSVCALIFGEQENLLVVKLN